MRVGSASIKRWIFTVVFAFALSTLNFSSGWAEEKTGTKGPIGSTGKTSSGVSGPVKGTTPSKLKSDIIVINAPVKKVSGATGAVGPRGPAGPAGPPGPEGQEGMVGPQGPEGLQGPQGIQGIQGIQGPVGPQGPQGIPGVAGARGEKGEKGDPGPQGPAGPAGRDGASGGGGGNGSPGPQGSPGPSGPPGKDGTSITILGTYSSASALTAAHPTGNSGDGYLVDGDLFIWSSNTSEWKNVGTIRGPQGIQGSPGPSGPSGAPGPSGSPGRDGISSLLVARASPSASFSSSESCSSGYVVSGLRYVSGTLTFACVEMKGSDDHDSDSSHDDDEHSWGDGDSKTKTTLAVAGLLGPTLTSLGASSCTSPQVVTGLTVDTNGDFGVTCGTPASGSLSSSSVSSTQCSGSNGFANGLTYTNSKLTISCTSTIPKFSDNAIVNGTSGGNFSYDGSNFLVTIPSGVLGLTLGTSVSCSGSDKVSSLTTDSNGKLKVNCSSDNTSSFSSSNISTTQCSSNEFASGLRAATTSSVGVNCTTRTLPNFSTTTANFMTASPGPTYPGSMSYDGTRFTVIIPSGILGSTITLDTNNDSCSGSDKVSAITLTSNVLRVVCATDSVTPISSVTVNSLSSGANPTATYSSSSRSLTLGIPAGATGPQGQQGVAGSNGSNGLTPTIAVNPTISSGSAAVSSTQTTVNGVPLYTFSFTLPSIPTGYTERFACFKSDGSVLILNSSGSSCSGTRYKILLATVSS